MDLKVNELAQAAGLNNLGGVYTTRLLMSLLQFNKAGRFFEDLKKLQPEAFVEEFIEKLDLKIEVNEEDLKKIPKTGAFITVSNHPFGVIDGLLLIYLISKVRSDFKLLGNYILSQFANLDKFLITKEDYNVLNKYKNSNESFKVATEYLAEGGVVGLFPANQVSTSQAENRWVSDKEWEFHSLDFIKKAEVPVVPIYFQGYNGSMFHLLGKISPALQTLKLPNETMKQKSKTIAVRIGSPISLKDQNEFKDISRYGRFLRTKTYSLGSTIEVKKFFNYSLKRAQKVEEIIPETDPNLVENEVNKAREDYLLFVNKNYEVYCAPSMEVPNVLNEIGRLREITFRDVGEGTNRSQDVDEFDLYYHQLFIWDTEDKKIVGAYRVGMGREILNQFGIKGFYLQSLFKMKKDLLPLLAESLELGRSFIVKEYQRKPLPLFLLWKGIICFIMRHPEYRYMIGPVSISSRFSNFSKQMIMDFIKANYYNDELAKYVKPRSRITISEKGADTDILIDKSKDINYLDRIIKEVESGKYRMPVLLKKYMQLNGKIIGFNVDPKFNNALDGLLVVDLFKIPMDILSSVTKELNDKEMMERIQAMEACKEI